MTQIRISKNGIIAFMDEYVVMDLSMGALIATVSIALAIGLAFYVLRAWGIYILAKKNGVEKPFLAWIPCLWVYTACKTVAEFKFFGSSYKKLAVWICVIFASLRVMNLFIAITNYFPYLAYFLEGGGDVILEENTQGFLVLGIEGAPLNNFFDVKAINVVCTVFNYLTYILNVAWIVSEVSLFIVLFKKFWPEHYILASVLSIFGLFPIFVFAVRNRKAVNFADYFRSRYYGMGGPQNINPENGNFQSQRPPEQPFSEFEDGKKKDPGNPFSEFDEKSSNGHDSENK